MANDALTIISAISRKGGCGKSTVLRALASAAAADHRRVTLIDTDSQAALVGWYERARANSMVPTGAEMITVGSPQELEETLDAIYEGNTADFVFIDTPGTAGEWADAVAVLSDVIVTPIRLSETDVEVTRQTLRWHEGLGERLADPADVPPLRVLINDLPSPTTLAMERAIHEIHATMPLMQTIFSRRPAFLDMDIQGFLGNSADHLAKSTSPLTRLHARRFDSALQEARDALNELVEVRNGG